MSLRRRLCEQLLGRRTRSAAALGAALAALLGAERAGRAEPLPNNRYAIDLFQGPILAPIHVTGIAGSYAGYAEGIEGMVANAAAPAVRQPFSVNYVELDASASVSIPLALFKNDDFDNSGDIDYDYSNFIYVTAGGLLQIGPAGAGFTTELSRYSLTAPSGDVTNVTVGKYHVLGALRLFGDQLMIGAGPRVVTLGVSAKDVELTIAGIAPEVGVLVRPDWKSIRLGATYRAPVDAGQFLGNVSADEHGVKRAGGLVVPSRVVLPWELELGLAVQVGPRPLNPEWIDPHDQEAEMRATIAREERDRAQARTAELSTVSDPAERAERARELDAEEERSKKAAAKRFHDAAEILRRERRARYWNWPREHLLVTAELLVSGRVADGVGLERFLGQNQPLLGCEGLTSRSETYDCVRRANASVIGTSGASTNFAPRFGIETEPIPNYVHTRFGSYYEPNRFGRPVGRQHFTFGADLRMFPTTWWGLVPEVIYKLQASFDLAPRYESVSLGIGVWH